MKTVFNNDEIAHIWAKQSQDSGRTSSNSVYFQGVNIFSYGPHFCLGHFHDAQTVFLNSRTFSNTTNRHQFKTWRAVSHLNLLYVPFPEGGLFEGSRGKTNCNVWRRDLETLLYKIEAKGLHKKTKELARANMAKIAQTVTNWAQLTTTNLAKEQENEYAEQDRLALQYLMNYAEGAKGSAEEMRAAIDAHWAEVEKAKEKRNRAAIKKAESRVKSWIQGKEKIDALSILPACYLRASNCGQDVQTSKGAAVTAKTAKVLYKLIKAGKDVRGFDVDGYTVLSINGVLTVGCHTIERAEIERFAKSQNW
jgi:hypothetical protein